MNEMEKRISEIGVVPVIKLNHPERDAAPSGPDGKSVALIPIISGTDSINQCH